MNNLHFYHLLSLLPVSLVFEKVRCGGGVGEGCAGLVREQGDRGDMHRAIYKVGSGITSSISIRVLGRSGQERTQYLQEKVGRKDLQK